VRAAVDHPAVALRAHGRVPRRPPSAERATTTSRTCPGATVRHAAYTVSPAPARRRCGSTGSSRPRARARWAASCARRRSSARGTSRSARRARPSHAANTVSPARRLERVEVERPERPRPVRSRSPAPDQRRPPSSARGEGGGRSSGTAAGRLLPHGPQRVHGARLGPNASLGGALAVRLDGPNGSRSWRPGRPARPGPPASTGPRGGAARRCRRPGADTHATSRRPSGRDGRGRGARLGWHRRPSPAAAGRTPARPSAARRAQASAATRRRPAASGRAERRRMRHLRSPHLAHA
jgi:hypothetical protein